MMNLVNVRSFAASWSQSLGGLKMMKDPVELDGGL
jgi:hypothetical protein